LKKNSAPASAANAASSQKQRQGMNELFKKSDELTAKIRRLIEKQEKLQADLAGARETIDSLQKTLEEKEATMEKLQRDANALRLGQFIELSDKEKKEVRKKINDYLKELDQIIERINGLG
jgi:archaellum component FlaC